jgi:hypothetical protein
VNSLEYDELMNDHHYIEMDTREHLVGGIRTFKTGATRDIEDGKLDWEGFLSPRALRIYAEYMHRHRLQSDGDMREADNWQKGMPRGSYMKSLVRHTMDLWDQWDTDPSNEEQLKELLSAVIFNAQGLLLEIALGRSVGHGQ